ncbi:MAG: hypothetical protein AB8B71_08860 [Paracoccaceae bacterium]
MNPVDRLGDSFSDDLTYLSELFDFRKVLMQNVIDSTEMDQNPSHCILYVFDANVLQLCFNPTENKRLIRIPFVDSSEDVELGIAIITAHFLLQGDLPGRRGYPAYVSKSHWEEFRSGRNGIRDTIDTYNRARRNMPPQLAVEIKTQLERCSSAMRNASGNMKEVTKVVREQVLPLFLSQDFETVARGRVLRSLLRDGRHVRPLNLAPFLRPGQQMEQMEGAVEVWRTELRSAYESKEAADRRRDNIARDAETLAEIQTLNAQFVKEHVAAKAVLVTADEAVHRAAQKVYSDKDGHFVRRVTQYLPLINFRDMANSVEQHHATSELSLAIDALIQDPRDAESGGRYSLEGLTELDLKQLDHGLKNDLQVRRVIARYAKTNREAERKARVILQELEKQIRKKYEHMLDDRLNETIREVATYWEQLSENSMFANRALIEGYYKSWWSDFLENGIETNIPFAQARSMSLIFEKEQINLSHDLARVHFEQVVMSDIRSSRRMAEHWASVTMGLRMDWRLQAQAKRAVEAITGGHWSETEIAITNLCQAREVASEDLALACASLALQCGRWATASELSRHVISLREVDNHDAHASTVVLPRAQLVNVVSRRAILLELAPSKEVRGVRQEVDACLALADAAELGFTNSNGGYAVELAILLAERAALRASLLMHLVARPSQKTAPEELMAMLRAIAMDASAVEDALPSEEAQDFMGRDITSLVHCRAAAAVLEGLMCAKFFNLTAPHVLRVLADEALQILQSRASAAGPGRNFQDLASVAQQAYFGQANAPSLASDGEVSVPLGKEPFCFQLDVEFLAEVQRKLKGPEPA